MKQMINDRVMSVELEEALADFLAYGTVDGGHNLFSDILPKICSLDQAGEILARHADELAGYAHTVKSCLQQSGKRVTTSPTSSLQNGGRIPKPQIHMRDSKGSLSLSDKTQGREKTSDHKTEGKSFLTGEQSLAEEWKHIAIGVTDTVLLVVLAFFFSLCILQHFYPLV